MSTITTKSLRRYNVFAGFLHLGQAIAVLLLSKEFLLPISGSFLKFDPAAQALQPATATIFDLSLPWLVAGFFLLSAAAQSAVIGMPSVASFAIAVLIHAATVAALGIVTAQSFHFLRIEAPMTAHFVPIVYFMALVQVLAIPLSVLGPNAQLLAVVALGVLIWRAGMVLVGMRLGVAIAFALLCLMVLVVVPNALYIVFLQIPSPA